VLIHLVDLREEYLARDRRRGARLQQARLSTRAAGEDGSEVAGVGTSFFLSSFRP
jgi:hypothetical protein